VSTLGAVNDARIPAVLSIAGSDSGGGAGIQADLKAFAACGVHGMTAITAITAQNTVGVTAVHQVPADMIVAQVRAVQEDIGVDAVKIGMLGNVETIEAVARALALLSPDVPIVLDPVMVSESGAELLEPAARRRLVELLVPRVSVITPNVPEAQALAGEGSRLDPIEGSRLDPIEGSRLDPIALARALHALGPGAVVVTGGHREEAVDVFFDGERLEEIGATRYEASAAHGSGCTHSSVLASRLAWGDERLQAARVAKELASRAVRDGLAGIGAGPGPVDVLAIAYRANDRIPLAARAPLT
jgi:hydroxymethylpyrimidine/phosphomethylpyrimidine kinase